MSVSEAQSEGITMSGGGLYSLATTGAKHVIDAATPLVLNAISTLPLESIERSFTISDMGCADAGTSLTMIGKVIDAVSRPVLLTRLSGLYIPISHTTISTR